VESGTVSVLMTDLSVIGLRDALLREFAHVAQQKGLTFSIDLASNTPREIFTDPQRLRQVLKNLLANAFKFTQTGGVHVEISLAESGWNPDVPSLVNAPAVLALSIGDTGIGIEPEHQQRIFEAFAQGDGSTARRFGGTGLGLSISRALVDLLGGEITLRSQPGEGSAFTVYLPVSQAEVTPDVEPLVDVTRPTQPPLTELLVTKSSGPFSPVADHTMTIDDHLFAGLKVLVVDDDFRNVFAMTALLERGWAEVLTAENGIDAIALLESSPDIDIVLMDIMMPEMDGYSAIRVIRTLEHFDDLTIIAVTGKVVAGERERCVAAGANDYISKPVNTVGLLTALRPWMSKMKKVSL
jgi:two-component system chemotaxis sensor kinase CheA